MKLAFTTDLHLNFCDDRNFQAFCKEVLAEKPDALVVTGDTAEAQCLDKYLKKLKTFLKIPIYFVLGNHDFYNGSVVGVREQMSVLMKRTDDLHYLPEPGPIEIAPGVCILGVDGWGDCRLGSAMGIGNRIPWLNDWECIAELWPYRNDRMALAEQVEELGRQDAQQAKDWVNKALKDYDHLVFATHVPPFKSACTYNGAPSEVSWLPWFCCYSVGEVLREAMEANPDKQMTVLCGHTHGYSQVSILPNLSVHTGTAEYRFPELQCVYDFGE